MCRRISWPTALLAVQGYKPSAVDPRGKEEASAAGAAALGAAAAMLVRGRFDAEVIAKKAERVGAWPEAGGGGGRGLGEAMPTYL